MIILVVSITQIDARHCINYYYYNERVGLFIDVQQSRSFVVRLMMERKKRQVLVGTMCTLVAKYNNGENKVKSLQLQCLFVQCETLTKLFFDNAEKRHICFPCTAITATFCAASFMNQAEFFFPFCDLQLKIAKFQTPGA